MGVPHYRIVSWDQFETPESKKRKGPLKWLAIPTRHDGARYNRVMAHDNAGDLFTAWILILEVAATCPIRGVLIDSHGRAIDADDLACRTRFPEHKFRMAFEVLTGSKIGWIEKVMDDGRVQENTHDPVNISPAMTSKSQKGDYGPIMGFPEAESKDSEVTETHAYITEPEHDTTPQDRIGQPESEEVVNSDSGSKPSQVLFGLSRAQGYIRWTAALTPLIGMDDGSRHPPQSKKYNADMTCMGRWFDQYVWPEEVADLVGRSNLAIAVERATAAQRSGKNPMAYLGGMIKDVFSDEGMSLPDH